MNRALILSVILVACSSADTSNNNGTPDASTGQHHDAAIANRDAHVVVHDAPTPDATSTANRTVFTIVLENMDYNEIVGSTHAPYLNSLIASYGLATNYKDTGHPSLPLQSRCRQSQSPCVRYSLSIKIAPLPCRQSFCWSLSK